MHDISKDHMCYGWHAQYVGRVQEEWRGNWDRSQRAFIYHAMEFECSCSFKKNHISGQWQLKKIKFLYEFNL